VHDLSEENSAQIFSSRAVQENKFQLFSPLTDRDSPTNLNIWYRKHSTSNEHRCT